MGLEIGAYVPLYEKRDSTTTAAELREIQNTHRRNQVELRRMQLDRKKEKSRKYLEKRDSLAQQYKDQNKEMYEKMMEQNKLLRTKRLDIIEKQIELIKQEYGLH